MQPLTIGIWIVIAVAVIIVCSVIISGLSQQALLNTARQKIEAKEVQLNQAEAELLKELKRSWLRDEILPVALDNYNAILMPDRKLIITLGKPAAEPTLRKTGWLVLDLTAYEVQQAPSETAALIQRFLSNARLVAQERATKTTPAK